MIFADVALLAGTLVASFAAGYIFARPRPVERRGAVGVTAPLSPVVWSTRAPTVAGFRRPRSRI